MSENNEYQSYKESGSGAQMSFGGKLISSLPRIILGIVILVAAFAISNYWIKNRPRAHRKRPEPKAALVEVTPVKIIDHDVTVDAMGTVVPARILDLTSRVGGEVVKVSPEYFPGGMLHENDIVAEIDKSDYLLTLEETKAALEKASLNIEQSELLIEQSELSIKQSELAILQRKTDIVKAEKDLTLELGQQKIAKREYEVLGEKINEADEELVLRVPQLKAAEAAVEAAKARLSEAQAAKKSAEAAKNVAISKMKSAEAEKRNAALKVEKAKLDLARTGIKAPFNAVIQKKRVEIGAQISVGAPIVTIVDSNEYWVEVSIPVDRLKWITIPTPKNPEGSSVKIYHEAAWGKDMFRKGKVKQLMTEVEAEGRMARVLISVDDPLSLRPENADLSKMILGSYVRVEIEGNKLSDVVKVSRASLRDQDKVWIMSPENTLDVREVTVSWSDDGFVYLSDRLDDGELLITSDLATPVNGMELRLFDEPEDATAKKAENEYNDNEEYR